MNGYELSRDWFDFCFEHPDKVKPNHTATYFFIVEHCNRLGWKEKFGLPTTMVMEAIGIKSYNTYIKALNDLVDWGFIFLIEKSKNQYSSNIIALSKNNKALDKALDKALIKHASKQSESKVQSIDSIIKQITNKQIIIEQINQEQKDFLLDFLNSDEKKEDGVLDFNYLLDFIKEKTNRNFRAINDSVKKKYKARLKEGYTLGDIEKAITNAVKQKNHIDNGNTYLTPEFFSRADKIDMYSVDSVKSTKQIKPDRPVF